MQLRLIALDGAQAGRQCQFDSEWVGQWLLLGRSHESALPLQDAPMVSVRHAVLRVEDDGFYLMDQQSTNGTMVNGQRVERVKLRHDDVIQLGTNGPQLRVVLESSPQPVLYETNVASYETNLGEIAAPPPPQAPPVVPATPSLHTFGLYQPENDLGKVPRSLGLAFAALCGVALGFVLLTLTVSSLGIATTVIAAVFAFVPAMFYLMIFLWLDRYDPEPFGTLAFAFGWGALFAILVSGIFNTLFGAAASNVIGTAAADTLTGVFSAPIIEEATKGLGVLLIWYIFRKDFDSVVDGIVYAGVVALGFAAMENVDYYGRSFNEEGVSGLITTFILRGVLSPFSHVLFTCMTGIGCGYARESHQPGVRWIAPAAGYVAAMFLHALWNTLASFRSETFFFGYFVLQVPLFIIFVCSFVYLVRREGRILQQSLSFEVQRGLLTPEQLNMLVSLTGRTRWVMAAAGNTVRMEARRQFLRAASKLGLCHWHVSRAISAQSQTASFPLIPRLQAELLALRERI
jgi:RsiW-degrading membrane proteinase PrsW (M82 family)